MSSHMQKRPTLKTIAEMTGLSLSTVSLSLREGNNLKKTTRDKVAKAAAQIGYVPNRAGVRLRTGRTNVLSLVLAHDENSLDFTRMLIQGIGSKLQGTPFHLNVVPEIAPDDPEASVKYILENRSSDGVILTHTSARDPRVQLLMDADFPFVSHGRTEFYSPHAYHDFNVERFVELAIERLQRKGRKNILLAAVDNGTTNHSTIVGGFNRCIAERGLVGNTVKENNVFSCTTKAREFGHSLAQREIPIDAIICNNELIALAIINGLNDKNQKLGKDYDLICRQTTEILPILYPAMDTIAEDLFDAGEELAQLLIKRIEGCDINELQTLHDPIAHWRGDFSE